jgi:hypothetical protein
MKARHWLLGAAIVLLAIVMLWVVVAARHGDIPLYAAGTVMTGLREHPDRWFGKTVAVRGIARGSVVDQGVLKEILLEPFPANMEPPSSVEPVSTSTQPLTIIVSTTPRDSVLAFVQHFPLLSSLFPARPVTLDATGQGTYRIAIVDASGDPGCAIRPCYRALALDPVSGGAVAGVGE